MERKICRDEHADRYAKIYRERAERSKSEKNSVSNGNPGPSRRCAAGCSSVFVADLGIKLASTGGRSSANAYLGQGPGSCH